MNCLFSPTSLFHVQAGSPHFTETVLIMAKDKTKQSIRNVLLPNDCGENNRKKKIQRPQFLAAAKRYMALQTGDWLLWHFSW